MGMVLNKRDRRNRTLNRPMAKQKDICHCGWCDVCKANPDLKSTSPVKTKIGLWYVNTKILYDYLSSIESDWNNTEYKFSERCYIHRELFNSLELGDTNHNNYKLLLRLAKGKYYAKMPKSKDAGRGSIVGLDVIERPPPIIHMVKCTVCKGKMKLCPNYHSSGRCKCIKIKCTDCVNGQMEEKTYTNANDIKHNPDSWTIGTLSEKQKKLLKSMHFDHSVVLALMWDFSVCLEEWIEEQLEKDKEFLR